MKCVGLILMVLISAGCSSWPYYRAVAPEGYTEAQAMKDHNDCLLEGMKVGSSQQKTMYNVCMQGRNYKMVLVRDE